MNSINHFETQVEEKNKMQSDQQLCDELQRIQLDFQFRKFQRRERLSTIKTKIESKAVIRQRKKQNLFLYIINLALPVTLSYLNAYVLLDVEGDQELKGYLIDIFVCIGFLTSIVSNLLIAPWRQVVKLYFLIDSLAPVIVASTIAFYAIHDFFDSGTWYQKSYYFIFPFWVFYFAGSIRVMIAYLDWSKRKILLYKLSVLASGLIFFYVGFTYMRGGYKITHGRFSSVEQNLKNIIYLYVFGLCQFFFEYFKKLSEFDQTDQLKYVYEFKDKIEEKQSGIRKIQLDNIKSQMMKEELREQEELKDVELKITPKLSNKPLRFSTLYRQR